MKQKYMLNEHIFLVLFDFPNQLFVLCSRFNYKARLTDRLRPDALTVNIFKDRIMQGQAGVSVNVTLPELSGIVR